MSINLAGKNCPDCGKPLHIGQHKFDDGLFEVWNCKECGFKKETPIQEKIKYIRFSKLFVNLNFFRD